MENEIKLPLRPGSRVRHWINNKNATVVAAPEQRYDSDQTPVVIDGSMHVSFWLTDSLVPEVAEQSQDEVVITDFTTSCQHGTYVGAFCPVCGPRPGMAGPSDPCTDAECLKHARLHHPSENPCHKQLSEDRTAEVQAYTDDEIRAAVAALRKYASTTGYEDMLVELWDRYERTIQAKSDTGYVKELEGVLRSELDWIRCRNCGLISPSENVWSWECTRCRKNA